VGRSSPRVGKHTDPSGKINVNTTREDSVNMINHSMKSEFSFTPKHPPASSAGFFIYLNCAGATASMTRRIGRARTLRDVRRHQDRHARRLPFPPSVSPAAELWLEGTPVHSQATAEDVCLKKNLDQHFRLQRQGQRRRSVRGEASPRPRAATTHESSNHQHSYRRWDHRHRCRRGGVLGVARSRPGDRASGR